MGKYDFLRTYLKSKKHQKITLSFEKIETIIKADLPQSAYTHREWWSNGGHIHASAWIDAGYLVRKIDFDKKYVVFEKNILSNFQTQKAPASREKTTNFLKF